MFAACEQISINEEHSMVKENFRSLQVSFEEDDTRIQLNEDRKIVWTKDDRVSVFYRSNVNEEWRFMGETGGITGELNPVDNSICPPETLNRVVVVYPYNSDYFFNTETYNIQASLPEMQNYLEGSYGTNGNIMVSSNEADQVSLKSVCGWLKLQLTGEGEVIKSITFRGNKEEQVAGRIYINTADASSILSSTPGDATEGGNNEDGSENTGGTGGSLVRPGTVFTEVTLDCGEGVTLSSEATAFYIALPPQTFADGFSVEITAPNGATITKETTNTLDIQRNCIQPMKAFEVDFPILESECSEIWYTSTDGMVVNPTLSSAFDATIVSNTYENGKGVIKFDGPITMIGEGAFEGVYSPNTRLQSITIPEGVTTIGLRAFRYCYDLTEVNLPESLTTIEERAFIYCSFKSIDIPDAVTFIGAQAFDSTSLTSVVIPDNVTVLGRMAFGYCDNLESITFGKSVTEIGDQVCEGCEKLTHVVIPDNVVKLGAHAFTYCTSMQKITIGSGVKEFGESAFTNCTGTLELHSNLLKYDALKYSKFSELIIGDEVTELMADTAYAPITKLTIGSGLRKMMSSFTSSLKTVNIKSTNDWFKIEFANASSNPLYNGATLYVDGKQVTEIFVPTDITKIGDYQMYSYTGVYTVYIPSNIKEIGISAFEGCNHISTLVLGSGIETISKYAFSGCSLLQKVTIPSSVQSIGAYAFSKCTNLYQLNLSHGLKSIGDRAFYYCQNISNLYIPSSVTSIGDSAFYYCNSLSSISIPSSVTSIGDGAFYGCSSVTSLTINNGVTTISPSAFSGCKITTLTIPESVSSIGYNAFNCSTLESVYVNRLIPASIVDDDDDWYAFGWNNSKLVIYVPTESVDLYKSKWSEYKNQIVSNGNEPTTKTTTYKYTTSNNAKITVSGVPVKSHTYSNGEGELVLYGEMDYIPGSLFYNKSTLTSITIPDHIKTLGSSQFTTTNIQAFYGKFASADNRCLIVDGELKYYAKASGAEYTIPDNVTSIALSVFSDCSTLTSVTIPNSVTNISNGAFYKCTKLTSLTIPGSVATIGNYAFEGCTSLTSLTIQEGVTTIGDDAFYGCNSLINVIVPSTVTSIGRYAFSGCTGKLTVNCNVPNVISYNGFYGAKFTEVIIGEGVTTIGQAAFSGCNQIASVTIPESVNSIASSAFSGCKQLSSVYCKATTPPSLGGSYIFYNNAADRLIYVPIESVEAYKSAERWSEYAEAIVGYNF